MATSDLNIRIRAQNETAGAFREALGDLMHFDTRLQDVAKGLTAFGGVISATVTAPMAAFGKAALDAAGDWEQSLNILQSVSGATAEQMERVRQVTKDLGADLSLPATSAVDAAKAMTELAKGGFDVEQAMDAAKGALQLAAAAGVDEAKAAQIMASTLAAFHLEASKAPMVADLLANMANASSMEITDAADAFKQASSVFSIFQGPVRGAEGAMQDLATATALMANAGIRGSDAGTSLKQMLLQLTGPSDVAKDAMRALAFAAAGGAESMDKLDQVLTGTKKEREEALKAIEREAENAGIALDSIGDIAFDAAGNMRPFEEIIRITAKGLEGLTDEQKFKAITTIFGADAARAAAILTEAVKDGATAWDEMAKKMAEAGSAAEVSNARMEGFKGAFEGLKSQLETLALVIGEQFLPIATDVAKKASEIVAAFVDMDPNLRNAALAFAGVVAVVGPLAVAIGGVTAALLLLNPAVLAVVAAAGALTAALGLLAAAYAGDFLGLRTTIIPALGEFKDKLGEIATAISELFPTLGRTVGGAVVEITTTIGEGIGEWTAAFIDWADDLIPALMQKLGDLGDAIGSWIREHVGPIGEALGQWSGAFANWVKELIPALGERLGELGSAIVTWIRERVTAIGEAVRGWIDAFIDWVKEVNPELGARLEWLWQTISEWIRQTANAVVETAKKIGQSIISGIAEGLDPRQLFQKAGEVARGIIDTMVGAIISGSPSRLAAEQVGRPIIEGIIVGMLSEQGALEEAAKDIGKAGVTSIELGFTAELPNVSKQLPAEFAKAVADSEADWRQIGEDIGEDVAEAMANSQPAIEQLRQLNTKWAQAVVTLAEGRWREAGADLGGDLAEGIARSDQALAELEGIVSSWTSAIEGDGSAWTESGEQIASYISSGVQSSLAGSALDWANRVRSELESGTWMFYDAGGVWGQAMSEGTAAGLEAGKGKIEQIVRDWTVAGQQIITAWAQTLPSQFWSSIPGGGFGGGGYFGGAYPGMGQPQPQPVQPTPGMPPPTQTPIGGIGINPPGYVSGPAPSPPPPPPPNPIELLSALMGVVRAEVQSVFPNDQIMVSAAEAMRAGTALWDRAAEFLATGSMDVGAFRQTLGDLWSLPQYGIHAWRWDPELFDFVQILARGGVVTRPTLALIGEAGPEAVIPLSDTRMRRDVHVHFHGPVYGMLEFGREVRRVLADLNRTGGLPL